MGGDSGGASGWPRFGRFGAKGRNRMTCRGIEPCPDSKFKSADQEMGDAESGAVTPESLAATLLALSPANRARLAALLLGQQTDPTARPVGGRHRYAGHSAVGSG